MNTVGWVVMCVLLLVVLLLVALLLKCGAAPATPRVGDRLRTGGAVGDIWDVGGKAPSTVPLQFPAYQLATNPDLALRWGEIRDAYVKQRATVEAAYTADSQPKSGKDAKWAPIGNRVARVRKGLEELIEMYRDPPALKKLTEAAKLRDLTIPGELAGLQSDMMPSGMAPSILTEVDVVRSASKLMTLLGTLPSPAPLPTLPAADPLVMWMASKTAGGSGLGAAGVVAAGHFPATAQSLVDVCDQYLQLRDNWGKWRTSDGKNLTITTAWILEGDAKIALFGAREVKDVINAYTTTPITETLAQQALLNCGSLTAACSDLAAALKTPLPGLCTAAAAVPAIATSLIIAAEPTAESAPLTESERLFHYTEPPKSTVEFVTQLPEMRSSPLGTAMPAALVIEASSESDLDGKLRRLGDVAGRKVYGLVTDRQGDRVALQKAVAINLGLGLSEAIRRSPADRRGGATGWLYDIVRLEGSGYLKRFRDYIRPELYAVDA